jgi:hypothetical protein
MQNSTLLVEYTWTPLEGRWRSPFFLAKKRHLKCYGGSLDLKSSPNQPENQVNKQLRYELKLCTSIRKDTGTF